MFTTLLYFPGNGSLICTVGIPEGARGGEEEEEGADQLGPPYCLLGAEENLYSSVRRPDGTTEDDPYARFSFVCRVIKPMLTVTFLTVYCILCLNITVLSHKVLCHLLYTVNYLISSYQDCYESIYHLSPFVNSKCTVLHCPVHNLMFSIYSNDPAIYTVKCTVNNLIFSVTLPCTLYCTVNNLMCSVTLQYTVNNLMFSVTL